MLVVHLSMYGLTIGTCNAYVIAGGFLSDGKQSDGARRLFVFAQTQNAVVLDATESDSPLTESQAGANAPSQLWDTTKKDIC